MSASRKNIHDLEMCPQYMDAPTVGVPDYETAKFYLVQMP